MPELRSTESAFCRFFLLVSYVSGILYDFVTWSYITLLGPISYKSFNSFAFANLWKKHAYGSFNFVNMHTANLRLYKISPSEVFFEMFCDWTIMGWFIWKMSFGLKWALQLIHLNFIFFLCCRNVCFTERH